MKVEEVVRVAIEITCGLCRHKWEQPDYPNELTVCPACGYEVGAEMKKLIGKYLELAKLTAQLRKIP